MTLLSRLLAWPGSLFYGWRIVAFAVIANFMGAGIYTYGFAVFFLPITRDLELTRAQTSLIYSLSQAEAAVGGPPAGWVTDRFGPRKVLFWATVLVSSGYFILAQVRSYELFLVVYLGLVSIAHNGGYGYAVQASVNSWFIKRRALAFSIALAAFTGSGAVAAPLFGWLSTEYGWRTALVVAAVGLAVVMLPVSQGFVRTPESMGLLPDGEPPTAADGTARKASTLNEFTVRQALRTAAFWHLTIATTLRLAVINVVNVHFVPIMVWKGMTETDAAIALGGMSLLGIPLRITLGWLGDKTGSKNGIIAAGMLLGTVGILGLQMATEAWHLWGFVIIFACMQSVIPLNWTLIGDYFGRKSYATLRGFMAMVYTGGIMAMPVIAGAVYDNIESYAPVVWALAGSMFASGIWFGLLRPPLPPQPALTGEVVAG